MSLPHDDILSVLKTANMNHIPSMEVPDIDYNDFFVAVVDECVVGVAGWKIILEDQLAKTTLMVVLPDYNNCGIGYKLQRTRMEFLYNKQIKNLITYSDIDYVVDWYINKFGYEIIGRMDKLCDFGSKSVYWNILKCDLRGYFDTNI